MSKNNNFEADLLEAIFYGTVAGVSGLVLSGTATKFWVALHASGGILEAGGQDTNEVAYGGYARVLVNRASSAWIIATGSTNTASPAAAITFASSTSAGDTITHFSVGTASAGTGYVYYAGTVTPNIAISASGITPSLTTGSTISED